MSKTRKRAIKRSDEEVADTNTDTEDDDDENESKRLKRACSQKTRAQRLNKDKEKNENLRRTRGRPRTRAESCNARKQSDQSNDYVCLICDEGFGTLEDLENHIKVHAPEKVYQCVECKKQFKSKKSQYSHQYLFHGIVEGLTPAWLDRLDRTKKSKFQGSDEEFDSGESDSDKSVDAKKEPDEKGPSDEKISPFVVNEFIPLEDSSNTTEITDVGASNAEFIFDDQYDDNMQGNDGDGMCDSTQAEKPPERRRGRQPGSRNRKSLGDEVAFIRHGNQKIYNCDTCGRDFKSIYSLKYHQKAIHGLKVELSPALEQRLAKKKRGIVPPVHIGRPTMVPVPEASLVNDYKQISPFQISDIMSMKTKEEKKFGELIISCDQNSSKSFDTSVHNLEPGQNIANNNCSNQNDSPELEEADSEHQNCSIISGCHISSVGKNSATTSSNIAELELNERESSSPVRDSFSPTDELMTPSAQFFAMPPSKEKDPLMWQSIKIQSEKVLVTRLEGIHPATEQQYILYKCCICCSAFPGLSMLCTHLISHNRSNKEHCCEKCGAIFKWRSQLEVHEQVHQVVDGKLSVIPSSVPSNFMLFNSLNSLNVQMVMNSLSPIPIPQPTPTPPTPRFIPTPAPTPHNSESSKNVAENTHRYLSRDAEKTSDRQKFPFQCQYCLKSFDRVFSLQRHERIHTGIKPCFCKVCGRGFSERRNLRHHIIRFHSDSSQRDLLRKPGRKVGRPPGSTSHKLVSFLKKTAVRILNSMDQTKGEGGISAKDDDLYEGIAFPDQPANYMKDMDQKEEKTPPKARGNSDDKVTVVIPEEVSDDSMTVSPATSDGNELMQDPKRSLIGSRRKGRPFKYVTSQFSEGEAVRNNDRSLPPEELNAVPVIKHAEKPKSKNKSSLSMYVAAPETSMVPEIKQEIYAMDSDDPSSITDEDKFKTFPDFKAKLKSHGSFFSTYNPRLGVISKPVARLEAIKPQVGPDGKHVYPCSYCYKTFCSTSDLKRHMDFHEDIRPFKCPYCDYYSRTNSQLKVHMMRHEGIKQFLCHICNYNGVTQSDLNRHCKTRTHLLRARNVCSCCGLGFYNKHLLNEHTNLFHQGQTSQMQDDDNDDEMSEVPPKNSIEGADNNPLSVANLVESNNNEYGFSCKNTVNNNT